MPTYIPLGGSARNYKIAETGEIISRRQYLKRTTGKSFEEIARENREKSLAEQILRPARGRRSALKAKGLEREIIAEARLEEKARTAKRAAELKAKIQLERRNEKFKNKRVYRKKVRKQLLQAGRMGARIALNDYSDYIDALKEAKSTGVVFAYSLGVVMINEDGDERDATLWTLQSVNNKPIPEDEFYSDSEEFVAEKTYSLTLGHWFMHVAFKKEFAREKALKAGLKIKW